MAQKTEDQAGTATDTIEKDSPLLDLTDQSVKKLLKTGKQRGRHGLQASDQLVGVSRLLTE